MTVSDKIRAARERAGLSQADIATAIGISQAGYAKIENGMTLRSRYITDVLRKLRLDVSGDPIPEPENYRPPPDFFGPRDLPVFAAVEGGAGEIVVSTDPIEWVMRPWFLREVKEGYAVIVTGESMSPVYEPGDLVIVNPKLQAIRGKNAIFVQGEEQGEFRATVKRLERSTEKDWHVRQWNPPEGAQQDFVLPKKQWPKALRIVGRYEGG